MVCAAALREGGAYHFSESEVRVVNDFYRRMLEVAVEEARQGLAEGGIPIGAALFTSGGELVSRGHNRRVQQGDPSIHGETDAFRRAGRQRSYRDKVMVTTLAPCWYCSGLVRQFRIGTVVIGESRTFAGGIDWLVRTSGLIVLAFIGGGALIGGGAALSNGYLVGLPWIVVGTLVLGLVIWRMVRRYQQGRL